MNFGDTCDGIEANYKQAMVPTSTAAPTVAGCGGREKGLGYMKTSFFIVAQMTGVGFLALPKALANSGWVGIVMILIFCVSVAFAVTRLGRSWVILEERWPQYRQPSRQPYMEIAERAFGSIARKICFWCVVATLLGYCIAFTILIGGMLNRLVPTLSICEWILIVTLILCPATFLESPKDFWQASVVAVIATTVSVIVIIVQLMLDIPLHPNPAHPTPSAASFSLGFSAILFAFGGASAFPTLQNDMEDRRDWWKSVCVGFSVILSLYMPVAVSGYVIIGVDVEDNIMGSVSEGILVIIAIAFVIVNLMGTYVICLNPVDQAFEELFNVPNSFNWKRVLVRTSIVLLVAFVCLAIPDFGIILNFFGGSTITILSFIFPPLMYMWLIDMKGEDNQWPQITIPLWERAYLWTIVFVGVVGGITSTVAALMKILTPETFGHSCLVHFNLGYED
uniref:Lysine histidine transporter 2-like n=1 Tax=Hirondellea gigas TaxID=1518452 RepID=A0A6A7GB99_9CRUS